jgi:hypothetical protein
VVEALDERGVEFSGRLSEDIENLSDRLRLTRNAVFHIPSPADGLGLTRGGFHDERLTSLMRKGDGDWTPDRETVPAISRVHSALGELLGRSRAPHPTSLSRVELASAGPSWPPRRLKPESLEEQ